MRIDKLQAHAAARAEELPGTELSQPFGPGWDVWKVRGKVFMLHSEHDGQPLVILKAVPADGQALQQQFAEITPGYHMNKKHWITVAPGGGVDEQLLDDLVTESYLLIVEGLPRTQRPVDPEAFAHQ